MESIAAGVMMLAWPLGADQFINAQLLVDQLGVALRVNCEGPASVPDSAELSRLLVESVSVTRPERERVWKLRVAAMDAVEEGGSSHENLNELVEQLSQWKGGAKKKNTDKGSSVAAGRSEMLKSQFVRRCGDRRPLLRGLVM
ncbi:hypothetical protein Nepgr_029072 [Nepenthes gracilis]|uniref:Uncharacterized protein n=1 Tax=Nepenthes gracilis TaxID=150966 RepID=A0AAD3TE31_NEPGR|nr:hypothetical protein Nepgr_029072 [Nepenthes gracilis]